MAEFLLHMRPVASIDDIGYCRPRNPYSAADLHMCHSVVGINSDLPDIVLGNNRWPRRFASRRIVSAALHHVASVIGKRSWIKMVGSYTRRIVATMANDHANWNWTNAEFIGNMSRAARGMVLLDHAVAIFIAISKPKPASLALRNFNPESFRQSRLGMLIAALKGAVYLRLLICVHREGVAAPEAVSYAARWRGDQYCSITQLGTILNLMPVRRGQPQFKGSLTPLANKCYFYVRHGVTSEIGCVVVRPVQAFIALVRAVCILPRLAEDF